MLLVDQNHVPTLKATYQDNDYPSDSLTKNHKALGGFTKEVNRRCSSEYTEEAIAHSIEHIRKAKKQTGGLPRIGRSYSGPRFIDN